MSESEPEQRPGNSILLKLVWGLGWLNIIAALAILLLFASGMLTTAGSALFSILLMQVLASSALIYSSQAKLKNEAIGHKVYPASLAACVLVALVALRWYFYA